MREISIYKMEEHNILDSFICDCGKSYATEASLKQHRRRHCAALRADDSADCPECGRSFATYAGKRLHLSKAHKKVYNELMIEEGQNAKERWTPDEEYHMAILESQYQGTTGLLDHLARSLKRSKEAIKGKRRSRKYQTLLQSAQSELNLGVTATPTNNSNLESSGERTPVVLTQQQQEHTEASLQVRIIEYVSNIPTEGLSLSELNLRDSIINRDQRNESLFNVAYENLINELNVQRTNGTHRNRSSEQARHQASLPANRNERRGRLYKITQQLFRKDRGKCAASIINGEPHTNSTLTPSDEDLRTHFQRIFGVRSSPHMLDSNATSNSAIEISIPISTEDITEAITHAKSSSAGPDGVKLDQIRRLRPNRLAIIFNYIMLHSIIPSSWRISRTILLQKQQEDLTNPNNWRPITISNILHRILNKILAKRANAVPMEANQRGFRNIDGVFANFALLDGLVKHHRQSGKPIAILSLDLTKAFDTISTEAIVCELRRKGVDPLFVNYIIECYKENKTTIYCQNREIGTFEVLTGVKQGDPISPFLFINALDKALADLNKTFKGVTVDNHSITSMAFADDLIIMSAAGKDLQRMLDYCNEYFKQRGLSINSSKSHCLILRTVPSKKKVYVDKNFTLKTNGEIIKSIDIGESFKYLGHKFDSQGMEKCQLRNLKEQLDRIMKAALKPQQKLQLVKFHLLPRYIASLQRPNIPQKTLNGADRIIRSAIRRILHLPKASANAILYTARKDGGMGIFHFKSMIPLIAISRWEKLTNICPTLRRMEGIMKHWIERYKRFIPENPNPKNAIKLKFKGDLDSSISGNGLTQVAADAANYKFIDNPPRIWNGQEYIRAIHLRFNILPTKANVSNRSGDTRCRARCLKKETLSHVLQNCPLTHWARIRRHNEIVKELAKAARKDHWMAHIEKVYRCTNNTLRKPDLTLTKGNEVIICDVGIHWEGPTPLSTQHERKQQYYSTPEFVGALSQAYPGSNISILPFIMGARGIIAGRNTSLIKKLRMTSHQLDRIVSKTLLGGSIIHGDFMKASWRINR